MCQGKHDLEETLKLLCVTLAALACATPALAADNTKSKIHQEMKRYYHADGYIKSIGNVAHRTIYSSNDRVRHKWKRAVRWLISVRNDAAQKLYRLRHPARTYVYGGSAVALGQAMAARYGWTGYEWTALYTLWNHESGWSVTAQNPGSAACGIPQAMNYCSYGHDPAVQIAWGLSYIKGRYRVPSVALGHWSAYGWY